MSISRKLKNAASGSSDGGGGSAGTYVDDVFSTYLYTGDRYSVPRTIENGIDLAGEGGLVWIKNSRCTPEATIFVQWIQREGVSGGYLHV